MSRLRSRRLDGIPGEKQPSAPEPSSIERAAFTNRVQTLLSPSFVESVYFAHRKGLRNRLLPLPLVALLLIAFCTDGHASFSALLDALREGLVPGLPAVLVSPQAFYRCLPRLGHSRFLLLLQAVTAHLHRISTTKRAWVNALAPWATAVVAIDDSTLDALARKLPELKAHLKGSTATLGGRISVVLDLMTGRLQDVSYDPDSATNEKVHFYPLLATLPVGALMVMDLGYFAFPLFDAITQHQKFFITRMQKAATFEVLQTRVNVPLYRDRLVSLGANRSDRAAHPVRLVELKLNGEWWRYLTNQLDAELLPAEAIWRLYLERWTIETAFFAIKRVVGLANVRASNLHGVLAQVWSTLTVYQLMQDLRLEVAAAQGLGEDDISWQRLAQRLALYTKVPSPKPSLKDWLKTRQRLKKMGQRQRRETTLPTAVLTDCRRARATLPLLESFPPRKPRQGKPARKRKINLIPGNLSVELNQM